MRWLPIEYVLKGTYLGLLLFVAGQQPGWPETGWVALAMLGGLLLALGAGAWELRREGYQARGRVAAFVLFVVLERPRLVYAGILLGLLAGALGVSRDANRTFLPAAVAGGAVLGLVFWRLRDIPDRRTRLVLGLVLAATLAGGLYYELQTDRLNVADPVRFGVHLLLGIPFFYLLTFAGEAEESEVEVAAMAAALGAGLGLAIATPVLRTLAFLVPVSLYFLYTIRVLPGLRVFKHVLRGLSYARVGRYGPALAAYRRALELAPGHALAREGLWAVHRALDLTAVARDPAMLRLIDLNMCLDRAASLLTQPPTPAQREEALRLLDLVEGQRPALRSSARYWRAVAHAHARDLDRAAAELTALLDPAANAPDDADRRSVLLPAWQLVVTQHPGLHQRVGAAQLALPGRRMEAIAAVERRLAEAADDTAAWDLKRLLYSGLAEADYQAAAATGAAREFDHAYALELGLALIHDRARWQRGAEYLRVAVHGLPAQAPCACVQLAQAYDREGQPEAARHYFTQAKQAARAIGPKNLPEAERHAFFAAVKQQAEGAAGRGDLDAAIADYHLYTEYERSGLETLRTLAELYERRGDPLGALRVTEQALLYSSSDKDLLARKDRYYYSVLPEDLQTRVEKVRNAFDVAYCLKKARTLLDGKANDLELVTWAQHLAELAQVVQPDSLTARVLRARGRLRLGERDAAVALLEEVRAGKPERFASGEDEEAWYLASRLLGDLYLNELGRADLAVPCYNDFRKSNKSGADTMYKLGQAYEQLGDRARAAKCYEHVTAYESHPLAPDARDALYRLQSS